MNPTHYEIVTKNNPTGTVLVSIKTKNRTQKLIVLEERRELISFVQGLRSLLGKIPPNERAVQDSADRFSTHWNDRLNTFN